MTHRRSRRPGRITPAHLVQAASLITERDRRVAVDCYEHGALTTEQITGLHFSRSRTARFRLNHLYELRVLDRFRPARPPRRGTAPFHWILDELGAHVVAATLDRDRNDLHWRRGSALALASSQTLAHRMATNEFFVRVAVEARAAGGSLREWYGERTAQLLFDGIVVPDSYGVVDLPGRDLLHLLLELDRSTEPLRRIRDKVAAYAKAIPRSELADLNALVVFAVPTSRRAAGVSAALSSHGSSHERSPFRVVVWSGSGMENASTLRRVLAARAASS